MLNQLPGCFQSLSLPLLRSVIQEATFLSQTSLPFGVQLVWPIGGSSKLAFMEQGQGISLPLGFLWPTGLIVSIMALAVADGPQLLGSVSLLTPTVPPDLGVIVASCY